MTQPEIVLRYCETCDGPGWQDLIAAVARTDFDAQVHLVSQACMNGCSSPSTLALQGTGRATYFFDGVDPVADVADIIATVRTYIDAPDGWIEDARPCGRLRFCLKGRVPSL